MPDFITDNLQGIIIAVVVVVALARKILEGINANQPDQRPGPTLEDLFGPDSEPEAMPRRRPATVPPPIRQATGPPPMQRGYVAAPAGDMNAELARQRAMEERVRKIREAKLKAQAASAPAHQVPVAHRQAAISHSLNVRLHNAKELRRAFILKEILDRPVGLR